MQNQNTKEHYIATFIRCVTAILLCVCLLPLNTMEVQAKGPAQSIGVGIDVSKYQGDIDWSAVAASGVQFAFVRAGSTRYGIDSYFDRNMTLASQNGVKTGVYFYSYAQNPAEAMTEAMVVLQAIAPYKVNMPVVIDMEDKTQKHLTPTELADIANTFCTVIEGAGYYPMIYANKYWFTEKIGPVAFDKWVAQYASACAVENAAFWQATNSASLPGIRGAVDLDYQYKDLSACIISDGFLYRKGFFYFYENYKMKTNSFVQFNGGTYYVDPYGHRVSGFAQLGDAIFFFDGDGLMATGWQVLDGNTHYFGTDGRMVVGFATIGDQSYLFDANGCMYRGWLPADRTYYFYEDGHMARGLSEIGKDIYYFDENGYLQVGWQKIADRTYCFDPTDAKMMKGLKVIGTDRYYFDLVSGAMQTGLLSVDGKIYFFGEDGKAAVGFRQLGEELYLFDAEGCMYHGWLPADRTYYFYEDGHMARGLSEIGKDIYYFDENGYLQVGWQKIADRTYCFDPADAKMMKGLKVIGTDRYYFDPVSGAMQTGLLSVDGKIYFFGEDGKAAVGLRQLGEDLYLFDAEGRMVIGQQIVGEDTIYVIDEKGRVTCVPIAAAY